MFVVLLAQSVESDSPERFKESGGTCQFPPSMTSNQKHKKKIQQPHPDSGKDQV
jgi:hypothetical protein